MPLTGEPISYRLFYNDTVGTFSDLIETFDQRAREVDGAFGNRLELFWEARSGRREQGSISQTLATSDLRLNAHVDRLYEIQKEDTTEALKELSRQSITLANYQEHRMLVDNSLAAREKLVFVAHSQGNLFYDEARDGRVGELDMANGIGGGPEHYAASCDAARIATGVYDVGIVNTGGGDGRKATVQLTSVDEGALLTRELDVGPVRGKRDRDAVIHVMSVIVDKDPDGTFKVTAR